MGVSEAELQAFAQDWWKNFAFSLPPGGDRATMVNEAIHPAHLAAFIRDALASFDASSCP